MLVKKIAGKRIYFNICVALHASCAPKTQRITRYDYSSKANPLATGHCPKCPNDLTLETGLREESVGRLSGTQPASSALVSKDASDFLARVPVSPRQLCRGWHCKLAAGETFKLGTGVPRPLWCRYHKCRTLDGSSGLKAPSKTFLQAMQGTVNPHLERFFFGGHSMIGFCPIFWKGPLFHSRCQRTGRSTKLPAFRTLRVYFNAWVAKWNAKTLLERCPSIDT